MPVTHLKVLAIADDPAFDDKLQPSDWHADHVVSVATSEIANNVVTNAKAAQMAANTVKMNNTGLLANAIDATLAQFKTWLALTLSDITTALGYTPANKNVSATDKVLGRFTAGAGDVEEIACTAAGRQLIDDADATAQRNTLVLGAADTVTHGQLNLTSLLDFSDATSATVSSNKELVLQQDGDTFGTSRFKIQNRSGSAGALFENVSLDLVDFGFKGNVGYQSNLRYEHRSSEIKGGVDTSVGEFQFIDDSTGAFSFVLTVNKTATIIHGGNLGIGDVFPVASRLMIQTQAAGTLGEILQAAASQTAPLSRWRTSTNAVIAEIGPGPTGRFDLYAAYTDSSNYERLGNVATVAADFKIIPEAAGTGTLRGLQMGVSGGKMGFYGTTAVTKPTALTASDGTLANAVTRIGELEAKLQSLGLLA